MNRISFRRRLLAIFLLVSVTLSSCFILGIHKNVRNPGRAGKYPHFNETDILLGDLNSRFRTCYDVTYYGISIKIDPEKKHLKGVVVMQATALTDFDTLQIDLHPGFILEKIYTSSGGCHLSNDKNFVRKRSAVFVDMHHRIRKGDIMTLQIFYSGTPKTAAKPPWKEGFTWKKDKEKNPWIGVSCESDGASIWWPCKDVTNDEPDSVFLSYSVPEGLTAVGNGQRLADAKGRLYRNVLEDDPQAGKGFSTFNWLVTYPINPYNVTVYVGKFGHLRDSMQSLTSGRTLYMNHYVLIPNLEKARAHFQQAKNQLRFFEEKFGEYPWYRDGYKLVEAPYSGMEHQTAIAYGSGYKNSYDGFDYIILHESAHEWWGNAITAADLSDVWLQEGFATYSEALYVEHKKGKQAYIDYLYFYRLFVKNKWPVKGPEHRRYFHFRNNDCYQKGAWILHTLRNTIRNDSVFFEIIRSFYSQYRYTTCTSRDFISIVQEKTGQDYSWFFRQYLNDRKSPMLEFCWTGDHIYYRWLDVHPDFRMEIDVIFDAKKTIRLLPGRDIRRMEIPGGPFQYASFDNLAQLFGINKNTSLPALYELRQTP